MVKAGAAVSTGFIDQTKRRDTPLSDKFVSFIILGAPQRFTKEPYSTGVPSFFLSIRTKWRPGQTTLLRSDPSDVCRIK